jgi:hypothetical protein
VETAARNNHPIAVIKKQLLLKGGPASSEVSGGATFLLFLTFFGKDDLYMKKRPELHGINSYNNNRFFN